jgi:flagella basal body P-ring formation protein FlgA
MLICIVKATNRIIEMQSGATAGTLLKNAIAQGYNEKDIIEKEVTPLEYQAALKVDPVVIAETAAIETAKTLEQAKLTAIQDNLPNWATIKTAIENATTIAALKVIVTKLARVVYWLAKNSEV